MGPAASQSQRRDNPPSSPPLSRKMRSEKRHGVDEDEDEDDGGDDKEDKDENDEDDKDRGDKTTKEAEVGKAG